MMYFCFIILIVVFILTRLAQGSPDEDEDFGADIVASICAGVEERGWDAKQLLHALLDGGKNSIFDGNSSKDKSDEIPNCE